MGGGMSKVQDMLDAIDWVVKGNADKYGNIDKDTFITAGSSCGGLEAYSAAYHNDRVKLIGVYNSGVIDPRKKPLLQELKASVLIMNGGPKDVGYANVSRMVCPRTATNVSIGRDRFPAIDQGAGVLRKLGYRPSGYLLC
jgi:hypothetical protein